MWLWLQAPLYGWTIGMYLYKLYINGLNYLVIMTTLHKKVFISTTIIAVFISWGSLASFKSS